MKLDNLILAKEDDITQVKIVDFGLAKQLRANELMQTVCGTTQVLM